ncbi:MULTISPECIES: phosphonate ABC transporter ATP-binding protein [Gemella]|uniref:phosphonate ABC transporter ATP-binding protein n=1 Tax=Gemella TaxID=1378 RepID=UPI0007680512|nr:MULTISPECIES: phosphonate ABC transporter ATP-binding protein [Gemella]AME09349.1 phosphonate ABC transporter ATP-binding protein [Gemella sp. oral taxon 928]AXI26985.1 phosphonate ABC transporter ATP-binding protein [Gemella sp. ND 6198]
MVNEEIKIENLSFSYGEKKVLDNLNFSINKGDFVAIVGKSGAGKSTLLRCLNLLNVPSGKIIINNNDITKFNKNELKKFRQKIAFIFQDYNTLDNLYTIDNVLTPYLAKKSFIQLMSGYTKKEYEQGITYLTQVGLNEEIFKKSKYLSGGQKQRVAIAKALAQEPNILLADEPVSSLDEKNTSIIMDNFQKLNKEKNITVLINLHDIVLAKKYSNKILGLKDGKILFYNYTESVTNDELKELYH